MKFGGRRGERDEDGPLAQEGDGGEERERDEVAVDAEDDLVHADVEDGLGEDVVAAVGDLDEGHPDVRPPRLVARPQQMPAAADGPHRRGPPLQQRRLAALPAGAGILHLHLRTRSPTPHPPPPAAEAGDRSLVLARRTPGRSRQTGGLLLACSCSACRVGVGGCACKIFILGLV